MSPQELKTRMDKTTSSERFIAARKAMTDRIKFLSKVQAEATADKNNEKAKPVGDRLESVMAGKSQSLALELTVMFRLLLDLKVASVIHHMNGVEPSLSTVSISGGTPVNVAKIKLAILTYQPQKKCKCCGHIQFMETRERHALPNNEWARNAAVIMRKSFIEHYRLAEFIQ